MNLCVHGLKNCFACKYDGEPVGAYEYGKLGEICETIVANSDNPDWFSERQVTGTVPACQDVSGRKKSKYMDDHCIHVIRLDFPCAECAAITGVKQVTGNDNPFYDLPYPVSSLRELVRAKDPHMSYCRYNIFKVAFRWEDKPNLRYNLEKARDAIDETLLSMPED